MKRILLPIVILVSTHFNILFCQNNSQHSLVPGENENVFEDHGQIFTYQAKDEVYVSIGFSSHTDGEYIFDMTIDNQSDDTLAFNPAQIHLFRYNQDTLAEKRIYYALDPRLVLDSIDNSIDERENKIKNNTILSIFLGAIYLTTEIAGFNGDIDYGALEAIRFTHDVAQMGLDIARQESGEKIYNLEFAGDYWLNGALRQGIVYPHSFESGKIHFQVQQSEFFKINVPIDNRIYRFTFQDVVRNNEMAQKIY